MIALSAYYLAYGADLAWIGGLNEAWGSNRFRWMSDNSEFDSSMFGAGQPEQYGQYAGLHAWWGGQPDKRIGDYPYSAGAYAVCETIAKSISFF